MARNKSSVYQQRKQLRALMLTGFNLSELQNLCFDLEVDFENLPVNHQGFVNGLIAYMQRMGRLRELIERIAELRPSLMTRELLSTFATEQISYDQLRFESLEVVAEVKLVLVGDGNVGKTSLVNRLVYGTFDPHEDTTRGVAITRWHINLPCIDGQNARINIWDFGGQGNMHATHPYFFSRKAVYLVVLNIREDDRVNRAEYWIRLIRTYGGNSPIIIVANKVDQFSTLLDQRSLRGVDVTNVLKT